MQGFAELEYGMLRYMGAIDDSTQVVTSGNFGFSLTTFVHLVSPEHFGVLFLTASITSYIMYILDSC